VRLGGVEEARALGAVCTFVERLDQRGDELVVVFERVRGLERRDGELGLLHREAQEAERAQDAPRARAALESGLETSSSALQVPAFAQELGKVADGTVVGRVDADCPRGGFFGRREVTERCERSPQQVLGFGVVGAPGEELAQCAGGVGGSALAQRQLDRVERFRSLAAGRAQGSLASLRLLGGGASSSSSSPSVSNASFFRR
jgi:hypothetical protein